MLAMHADDNLTPKTGLRQQGVTTRGTQKRGLSLMYPFTPSTSPKLMAVTLDDHLNTVPVVHAPRIAKHHHKVKNFLFYFAGRLIYTYSN